MGTKHPAPWEQTQDEFIGRFLVGDMFDLDAGSHEWIWDDEAGLLSSLEGGHWTSADGTRRGQLHLAALSPQLPPAAALSRPQLLRAFSLKNQCILCEVSFFVIFLLEK